jgi:hypothetical protein
MSNVDPVRGAHDAFAQGDVQAVIAALDEHVEWTETRVPSGTYVGPQACSGCARVPGPGARHDRSPAAEVDSVRPANPEAPSERQPGWWRRRRRA